MQRPFRDTWVMSQPLAAGSSETMEMKPYPAEGGKSLLGWVLLPTKVVFADGTVWAPQERGECFGTFWRDADHPTLEVVPPEQFETKED